MTCPIEADISAYLISACNATLNVITFSVVVWFLPNNNTTLGLFRFPYIAAISTMRSMLTCLSIFKVLQHSFIYPVISLTEARGVSKIFYFIFLFSIGKSNHSEICEMLTESL